MYGVPCEQGNTWNSRRAQQTVWKGNRYDGNKFHSCDGWDENHGASSALRSHVVCEHERFLTSWRNAKPLWDSISDCQNFVWACLGFFERNLMICWELLQDFIRVFSRCIGMKAEGVDRQRSHKCQKHQLQNMQSREIKFRKFVARKLIQVGKKWSNKQFEILNRSFIQRIVWNFTNPLVLTFQGFLLIYRFRSTGNDPKMQIRKHSWRKRKSEKCLKQTGSGSFVVACPQLRSLCPLRAIAYVWLGAQKPILRRLPQESKAILTKQLHASGSSGRNNVWWHCSTLNWSYRFVIVWVWTGVICFSL